MDSMDKTFETFNKENRLKLFGNEDAGREDDKRLSLYYYKTHQYEDIMSQINMQIVIGEKGTGKSALLKMAYIETCNEDSTVPIWIRLDDLTELYDQILNLNSLYSLKTLWKRAISKLVVMKLSSSMNYLLDEDCKKAAKWAYECGYSTRDFISKTAEILKPMYEKYININENYEPSGEHHILSRIIERKSVRLFLDDFDLDWRGNETDVTRIKSLLLSLSDMTTDMEGFSVRIALRTDVYEMIRNEEFSDKFESAIITCKWNNQEIMCALAKRICAYFGVEFDKKIINDDNAQYYIIKYLDYVFVPKFDNSTKIWRNAPTHRVMFSLIRRKPRDMVKLCQNVAEEAYKRKLSKIDTSCFISVLESYSQERFKDLVNEYSKQLPMLEKLLIRMAPTQKEFTAKANERYVYTTNELYNKIKNIQQNMTIKIYKGESEELCIADIHQIAHFLYKIGFITGRKRCDDKIIRTYHDENQYLLKSQIGDRGFSWEIHPAYRGALANGKNDKWELTLDPNE